MARYISQTKTPTQKFAQPVGTARQPDLGSAIQSIGRGMGDIALADKKIADQKEAADRKLAAAEVSSTLNTDLKAWMAETQNITTEQDNNLVDYSTTSTDPAFAKGLEEAVESKVSEATEVINNSDVDEETRKLLLTNTESKIRAFGGELAAEAKHKKRVQAIENARQEQAEVARSSVREFSLNPEIGGSLPTYSEVKEIVDSSLMDGYFGDGEKQQLVKQMYQEAVLTYSANPEANLSDVEDIPESEKSKIIKNIGVDRWRDVKNRFKEQHNLAVKRANVKREAKRASDFSQIMTDGISSINESENPAYQADRFIQDITPDIYQQYGVTEGDDILKDLESRLNRHASRVTVGAAPLSKEEKRNEVTKLWRAKSIVKDFNKLEEVVQYADKKNFTGQELSTLLGTWGAEHRNSLSSAKKSIRSGVLDNVETALRVEESNIATDSLADLMRSFSSPGRYTPKDMTNTLRLMYFEKELANYLSNKTDVEMKNLTVNQAMEDLSGTWEMSGDFTESQLMEFLGIEGYVEETEEITEEFDASELGR